MARAAARMPASPRHRRYQGGGPRQADALHQYRRHRPGRARRPPSPPPRPSRRRDHPQRLHRRSRHRHPVPARRPGARGRHRERFGPAARAGRGDARPVAAQRSTPARSHARRPGQPLNEIAAQSRVGIALDETAIPVHETVRGACEFLGLDPLYVANEGKLVAIVPPNSPPPCLRACADIPSAPMPPSSAR